VAGSVKVSGTQLTRRTADLTLEGGSTVYDLLTIPGTVIRVEHGIEYLWGDPELVPVFTGEVTTGAQTLGDGTIAVNVADFWQRVEARGFTTAYTPDPSATREGRDRRTGHRSVLSRRATVHTVDSTDTGTVGTTQTWESRADSSNSSRPTAAWKRSSDPTATSSSVMRRRSPTRPSGS
jgi:hypothetical protein